MKQTEDIDYMEIFQECELCHNIFDIFQMRITFEGNFYCDKCLKEYEYYEKNN